MPYPTLVGRVLATLRERAGIKQAELAGALGLSQSAYSRLESGESVLNVSQLRIASEYLQISLRELFRHVEAYERQLLEQGVQVVAEKQDKTAAVVLGFGLLAALLLGGK